MIQNNDYSSSYKSNRDKIVKQKKNLLKDRDLLEFLYEVKLDPSSIDFELVNENEIFNKSSNFVKSSFYSLIRNKSILFKYYNLYLIYFWLRPKRLIQIIISLIGNKNYYKDLLLIYTQLKLFINGFDTKNICILKKNIEFTFQKKFKNNNDLILFIINKRMGWE